MRGKIVVIEGTDCSGKETQSKKIIENLKEYNFKYFCFPNWDYSFTSHYHSIWKYKTEKR